MMPRTCLDRWLTPLLSIVLATFLAAPAKAQISQGEIPNAEYWLAMGVYNDGDFESARKTFVEAAKGGIKTANGQWVDSVCFHTMIGECYYEMGNLTLALDQYSSALKLYMANSNWMLSIDFPAAINPSPPTTVINWGQSTRVTKLGKYPDRFMLIQSTLSATAPDAKGNFNLVQGQQAIPIRAAEIARCTALAIRRRREIMGPASAYDRLTDQLLTVLARRPAPANNWSRCWVDIQLGLAYSAAGKSTQAVAELLKGLQAGGTYDHHLTALGLLELGHLSVQEGKYEAAGTFFAEATYSGAMFGRYDDVEEGFRGAQLCWLMSNKKGVYAPLAPATLWASKQEARKLDVALRLLAADNSTLVGDTAGAAVLLGTAQKAMFRKEMLLARSGARWNFEMARVNFNNGEMANGASNLGLAMKFQQASSKRLFQIGLCDNLAVSKTVTDREADTLYTEVLRDPTTIDWAMDPLESLTVGSTSFPAAIEHWFGVALARKEVEKAMEIADKLRRHRFYSTLPLGGRLLSLRWILEAPKDQLSEKAQLQRQDLLVKYPKYAEASLQASKVKGAIADLPAIAEDDDQRKKQIELYGNLARLSALQEVMLRDIALRRDGSDYVFPPPLDVKLLQQKLPPRTLMLSYIAIGGKVFGFAIGKDKYAAFPVDTLPRLKADLGSIFKAWGQDDKNRAVSIKNLENESWKATGRKILKAVTNNMKDDNWANFDDLIVVPDSLLWYVPFEALPLSDEENAEPLIHKIRVRYVPTTSLAIPDSQPRAPYDRTAVVAGKLFPRDDVSIASAAVDELDTKLPGVSRLMANIPAPSSLLVTNFDQLIVYHDLEDSSSGAYDWSPVPVDKAKPASRLTEWFALPWAGPRQVILPGFHSPAEMGLRKGGTGDEMFLTACAFMASGSKTVLLSRWRTGGQSSYDLMREFAIESPFASAPQAWQRSVLLERMHELEPSREPRLQSSESLDGMTAQHPFFWAGYVLIDTGSEPKSDKPKPVVEKAPEAEKKKPEEKKAEAAKPAEKMPEEKEKKRAAELDEEDGKLPPDLEALRKAPAVEPVKPMKKADQPKASVKKET